MGNQGLNANTALVNELSALPGPVVVSAPFGSGKTRLLNLIEALGHDPDLIVDDVSVEDLLRLVADEPNKPWRLACGWLTKDQRAQLGDRVRVVGQDELWFSIATLTGLLSERLGGSVVAPALAEAVLQQTHGWPILTDRIVAQLAAPGERFNDLREFMVSGPHLDEIAEAFWNQLRPEARSLAFDAARLSAITPAVADVLAQGHDGIDAIGRSGLPLVQQSSAVWHSFTFLANRRPPAFGASEDQVDPECVVGPEAGELAVALQRAFGLTQAVRELLALDMGEDCCRLIATAVQRGLQSDEAASLIALMARFRQGLATAPTTLILRARLCELVGSVAEARELLKTAEHVALQRDEDVVGLEAALRSALLSAVVEPELAMEAVVADLSLRNDRIGNHTTDLLLQLVRVTLAWDSSDQQVVSRSVVVGRELAQRFAHAQMPFEAARLLRRLAMGPCEHLWRFQLAGDLLDQSIDIERDTDLVRTKLVSVYRFALAAETVEVVDFSRWEEPATAILRAAQFRSFAAMYWNARLTFAALQGDAESAVVNACRSTEYFADFAGTHVETFYRSRAVCALSYCGSAAEAKEQLDQLESLAALNPLEAMMARITYEARCADPGRALELAADRVLVDELMPFERRWQLKAECYVARCRLGEGQPEDRDEVLMLATGFGMAQRASLMITDRATTRPPNSRRIRLLTFGRFTMLKGDLSIDLNGNSYPLQLIKLLCIRGPVMSVDAVIDALWPDGDYEACHRRLKNLVSRARSLIGQDAIHRAPKYISLTDEVEVDYAVFHRSAIEATGQSTTPERSMRAAREALDLVTGELLPGDLFASWAEEQRWQTEAVMHNLVQHVLVQAQPCDSAWLLSTARRVRVSDSNVFERIHDLAIEHGSPETARMAAEAAERARIDFGVDLNQASR